MAEGKSKWLLELRRAEESFNRTKGKEIEYTEGRGNTKGADENLRQMVMDKGMTDKEKTREEEEGQEEDRSQLGKAATEADQEGNDKGSWEQMKRMGG